MITSIHSITSSKESAKDSTYKKGEGHITIHWNWNMGYGNIYLIFEDGKLLIDSEHMDKDFVKLVLCKLVDNGEIIG